MQRHGLSDDDDRWPSTSSSAPVPGTLSVVQVARMSMLRLSRRSRRCVEESNSGEPFCPRCGCEAVYGYRTRQL